MIKNKLLFFLTTIFFLSLNICASDSNEEQFTYHYCLGSCPDRDDDELTHDMYNGAHRSHFEARNSDGARVGIISFGNSLESSHYKFQPNYIGALKVLKDYRKKGIGKTLWLKAVHELARRGCTHIEWASTTKAIPFYHKIGVPVSAFNGKKVCFKLSDEFLKTLEFLDEHKQNNAPNAHLKNTVILEPQN